eukprot:gb/GFBE01078640.1/.p1 GENE.gb/GFBE01078640.1/~~gb/GFBE01078640.1/.p1  ORF type:complete len:462 (+),score=109.32 gb/GFBE01078640.1/:1-1386(+)
MQCLARMRLVMLAALAAAPVAEGRSGLFDFMSKAMQTQQSKPGTGGLSLASMTGTLASLAASGGDPATVDQIKTYIAAMLTDINTQHDEHQAALNDESGYVACEEAMQSAIAELGNSTTTAAAPAPAPGPGATTTAAPAPAPGASTTAAAPGASTTAAAPSPGASTTAAGGASTTAAEGHAALQACYDELVAINNSVKTCWEEHDASEAAATAVCQLVTQKTVAEAKADRCSDTWDGTYEGYLENDLRILAEYRSRVQNCTAYQNETTNKRQVCEGQQQDLDDKREECANIIVPTPSPTPTPGPTPSPTPAPPAPTPGGTPAPPSPTPTPTPTPGPTPAPSPGPTPAPAEPADCAYYHGMVNVCVEYHTCHDGVRDAKVREKEDSVAMENSRAVQWVTLKRMDCLIDVVGSTGDQTSELEACINKPIDSYNTSHLTLTLPAERAKLDCNPQTPAECVVAER